VCCQNYRQRLQRHPNATTERDLKTFCSDFGNFRTRPHPTSERDLIQAAPHACQSAAGIQGFQRQGWGFVQEQLTRCFITVTKPPTSSLETPGTSTCIPDRYPRNILKLYLEPRDPRNIQLYIQLYPRPLRAQEPTAQTRDSFVVHGLGP
jgi:hypothetical protein